MRWKWLAEEMLDEFFSGSSSQRRLALKNRRFGVVIPQGTTELFADVFNQLDELSCA